MFIVVPTAFVKWVTKHVNEVGMTGLLVQGRYFLVKWKTVRQAALGAS